MIAKVVNDSGTLQFVNLAGASSGGLPVGSILALHTNRVPAGYLPCNGATYDITQYPALYTILQSNVLPDLREMNLVGAGSNTTQTIGTHDTYTIGQFKDDQVQETICSAESTVTDPGHCHSLDELTLCETCLCGKFDAGGAWNTTFTGGTGVFSTTNYNSNRKFSADGTTNGCTTVCFNSSHTHELESSTISTETTGVTVDTSLTCSSASRIGSTTHGKNYGVFYVIKAVTGITELDDAEVYSQVVALLETNYIQKSLFNDGGIPIYNSTTECFDQITPPQCNGLALSYDVTNCCYCWGETASAVSNLTDVCLSSLCDGQYLQYNATSCTWNNTTLAIDTNQICTQASYGCAYACTWCNGNYSCLKLYNGVYDSTEVSCIDLCCSLIEQVVCYDGSSPSGTTVCLTSGSFIVSTSDSWSSGDYSAYARMCISGYNVIFNAHADCCCGGCLVFNSTCNMCYDGNTGILYVHAICFI